MSAVRSNFLHQVEDRTASVGIIGLGYVGLPLAVEVARSGYRTLGFDVNEQVVEGVNAGESHIQDVSSQVLSAFVGEGLLQATTDLSRLAECDVISICVPTPLNKTKEPDLSYVVAAAHAVMHALRRGQLVILESTTYPGTTREVVLPILDQSELRVGEDFFLCFSPERVDPGNHVWHTRNTPKVMGGITPACGEVGVAFYEKVFDTLVPVESAEAAELVKVYENTFRMINIALANELAQACEKLGLDVWGVVEAAATKPFGFMKFTPGPGLGGHCIPLDPHYLSWKMRTLAFKTRMIELASEINAEMPAYVVRKVADALNDERKAVKGSRILVLGIAYKRDIDDLRESPALEVIRLLQEKGAQLFYHDPFCPLIEDDGHTPLAGLPMHSADLSDALLQAMDAVVVVTDHTPVDYQRVADSARLVVDTRGVMREYPGWARVVGISGQSQLPAAVARAPVRLAAVK
ncbi:MAG: nucleotide sugar dehydrogenase [Gemmatimonadetes bacterium]|jgi:UDP-N-acetyl-D-glucosamine dehydrogenase|nr:nucleotide sugar dehydrogenase [Gemmatimonadota bacterium]MBA4156804.1 nucleotide sugar dehydrogenase [Gemmatimonadota bacterium]